MQKCCLKMSFSRNKKVNKTKASQASAAIRWRERLWPVDAIGEPGSGLGASANPHDVQG